jgi:hypothetical protein
MPQNPRLGKLPPMYNFILNPHAETRVSRCPNCEAKMHQRKVPLFIHVDPMYPVVLGYTCRYCPDCDLLVAHQDQIEHLLANLFAERDPSIVGNDYLVMGTVERKAWRASLKKPMSPVEALEQLHDFKEVWSLEFRPAGWYRDEEIEADERAHAQAREQFEARTREPPRPEQPAKRRRKRRDKRRKKRR